MQYTYNSNHALATKPDAKGTVFNYSYDTLNRLLTVAAGGNTLRTYGYDTNSIDSSYSQNAQGRLTTITYAPVGYEVVFDWPAGSTTFTDMFSYPAPGQVTGKRLQVTKVQPTGPVSTQSGTGNLNMTYSYNAEGKLASVTYPFDATSGTTPQYNYSYDAMMRPAGMTDQSNSSLVSNVLYGAANEMLQMTYNGGTETRQYNSMFQLTHLSMPGQIDISYNFTGGANNGKIGSQTDNISGETVSYQYDSLNRNKLLRCSRLSCRRRTNDLLGHCFRIEHAAVSRNSYCVHLCKSLTGSPNGWQSDCPGGCLLQRQFRSDQYATSTQLDLGTVRSGHSCARSAS